MLWKKVDNFFENNKVRDFDERNRTAFWIKTIIPNEFQRARNK